MPQSHCFGLVYRFEKATVAHSIAKGCFAVFVSSDGVGAARRTTFDYYVLESDARAASALMATFKRIAPDRTCETSHPSRSKKRWAAGVTPRERV